MKKFFVFTALAILIVATLLGGFVYWYLARFQVAPEALAADPTSRATTTSGPILGFREQATFAYRGIPYAAPPIGELRWKAPRPVTD